MANFVGRFEYQLDTKSRLHLPADFRNEVPAGRWVVIRWENDHLTLFPDERWDQLKGELLELRRQDRKLAKRIREVISWAAEVEPDKQGRIRVPAKLAERAGLEGTTLILGNIDRVELWHPDRYDGQLPDEEELEGAKLEAMHGILG